MAAGLQISMAEFIELRDHFEREQKVVQETFGKLKNNLVVLGEMNPNDFSGNTAKQNKEFIYQVLIKTIDSIV